MKNILIKIIFILIVLMLLFSVTEKALAWSNIISAGNDFLETGKDNQTTVKEDEIRKTSGFIYNILLSAGVVIAVIIATILGVQFMISGVDGQAKVKEMLVPFVIGCVIVFGGFGIWKVAINIGDKLDSIDSGGGAGAQAPSGDTDTQKPEDGTGTQTPEENTDTQKPEEDTQTTPEICTHAWISTSGDAYVNRKCVFCNKEGKLQIFACGVNGCKETVFIHVANDTWKCATCGNQKEIK